MFIPSGHTDGHGMKGGWQGGAKAANMWVFERFDEA
jgi:hypothetical protein